MEMTDNEAERIYKISYKEKCQQVIEDRNHLPKYLKYNIKPIKNKLGWARFFDWLSVMAIFGYTISLTYKGPEAFFSIVPAIIYTILAAALIETKDTWYGPNQIISCINMDFTVIGLLTYFLFRKQVKKNLETVYPLPKYSFDPTKVETSRCIVEHIKATKLQEKEVLYSDINEELRELSVIKTELNELTGKYKASFSQASKSQLETIQFLNKRVDKSLEQLRKQKDVVEAVWAQFQQELNNTESKIELCKDSEKLETISKKLGVTEIKIIENYGVIQGLFAALNDYNSKFLSLQNDCLAITKGIQEINDVSSELVTT